MIELLHNFAASCTNSSFTDKFFGLPTWYKYLNTDPSPITGKCEVTFNLMDGGKFNGSDILLVGLGVIDILVRIAALAAVAFVLYGGLKYITSQGSPDGTKGAQNTILNAVIGLAISVVAAAVVAYLGNVLT